MADVIEEDDLPPICLDSLPGGGFQVKEPYPIAFVLGDGVTVAFQIPAGFHTDLASVPRLARPFICPSDVSLVAPAIHDYLYRADVHLADRQHADVIFRKAMEAEGVPTWRVWAAYLAVRVAGAFAYNARAVVAGAKAGAKAERRTDDSDGSDGDDQEGAA